MSVSMRDPIRLRPALAPALVLALAALLPAPAEADPGRWIARGDAGWIAAAGVFDTAGRHLHAEATIGHELPFRLFPDRWFEIGSEVGLTVHVEGGGWLWSALRLDWEVTERWTITPWTGVTLYEQGDGKDLGGVVEFRSGLEVGRRLGRGGRLGVAFYHLSNADIYDENPGSNSLVLVWRSR